VLRVEHFEGLAGIHRVGHRHDRRRHDPVQLSESIGAEAICFCHHADRPSVVDHDDGAVRPLGQ
jgi:hypothetical protein